MTPAEGGLSLWREGEAKRRLLDFVERTTTPGSDFVPEPDRVAVFDNDGTLWVEQPMYTQLRFALERAAGAVTDADRERIASQGYPALAELIASTHEGLTTEEFAALARAWIAEARHPRWDLPYTELVFAPMVQLLEHLRAHDFATYIVSGGGSEFLRAFAEEVYGVPPEGVVGSIVVTRYEVRDGVPALVRLPEIALVDDKEGKPVGVNAFIGRRPILAFGNSDGDFQLLEYTMAGDGPRLGLLLHHDDPEREFAYDRESRFGRLDRGLDEAAERGWLVVSMRDDFRRVFAFDEE